MVGRGLVGGLQGIELSIWKLGNIVLHIWPMYTTGG